MRLIASFRSVALATLGVAYVVRPLSCSYTLGRFSVDDNAPYAQFDRHGSSASYGLIGALACLYPLLWLARRIVPETPGGASRPSRNMTIGSACTALAIGAPSFAQIDYMTALPFAIMWPVVASVVAWAIVVTATWLACLRSASATREMAAVRYRAIGVATMVSLPKLMILTI